MTECNGCGACCDPVISVVPPPMLADGSADDVVGAEEADWMRAHLTPILPRRHGMKMVRSWSSGTTWFHAPGSADLHPVLSWFYRCDLYDAETRRCTDFANRPTMCRQYPWYEGDTQAERENKNLPPTCSFRADIGLPVEDFT